MTKVLRCGDFMPGCDYEARAESEGELLQEGGTARARSTRHRNHARADPAGQKQDSGRSLAVNSNKRPLARRIATNIVKRSPDELKWECLLLGVVSSGRRNTLSQTQEMEWMGDGSKICFEVSMRWPRRSCGTAGGTHSQFNRVARQLNERSRETLGFETRAARVLMLVLHRPIEPTAQSGHSSYGPAHTMSSARLVSVAMAAASNERALHRNKQPAKSVGAADIQALIGYDRV